MKICLKFELSSQNVYSIKWIGGIHSIFAYIMVQKTCRRKTHCTDFYLFKASSRKARHCWWCTQCLGQNIENLIDWQFWVHLTGCPSRIVQFTLTYTSLQTKEKTKKMKQRKHTVESFLFFQDKKFHFWRIDRGLRSVW